MKSVVVGAGGGGIASAILAALRGNSVTLVEAHENLGGCASWFNRGKVSFDVGATTLSGLTPEAPMGKLFELLGEYPKVKRADPGIVFHLSNGEKLSYYSDFEKWMSELERVFPDKDHRGFWRKVYKINQKAWSLLGLLNSFPFQKVSDFWKVIKSPSHYHLYPYLLVSTEMMLKRYQLDSPLYVELINGILLISAQAEAPQVPFLIGAMGLAYPQETYAPVGGMEGLMEFFERKCHELKIEILKKAYVSSIENHSVKLKDGRHLPADEVILNVPYWNVPSLFNSSEHEVIKKEFSDSKSAWGAFAVYFACNSEIKELYHQVHLNHPQVKNYFVSFTGDAPEGEQAVTISTHVLAEGWSSMEKAAYKELKLHYQNIIIEDFKTRFGIDNLRFITSGTPQTFQRYTHRQAGYVGGLPFLYGMNPWKLKGHTTPIPYVYQVGDTTFPGQGLVGVVAGAFGLDQSLR